MAESRKTALSPRNPEIWAGIAEINWPTAGIDSQICTMYKDRFA
jgi:hypothetical protein